MKVQISNPKLFRLLGILHGDGSLSSNRVTITDKHKEFHKVLLKIFQEIFGYTPSIYRDRTRNTFYTYTKKKEIVKFFLDIFGVPTLRKAKVPEFVAKAPLKLKKEYVGGLYDAEAHVKRRQKEIDFVTTNEEIFRIVNSVLQHTRIKFSILKRLRSSLNFEIYIYGEDNVNRFLSTIGFIHPIKLRACLTR